MIGILLHQYESVLKGITIHAHINIVPRRYMDFQMVFLISGQKKFL